MLKKLSENDELWRIFAYRITGNKDDADELVQEMYLRRYENYKEGQEFTEYYILCTLKSIYLNSKVTKANKMLVNVEKYFDIPDDVIAFEPTDEEYEFIEAAKKLSFKDRELLELSYDMSLREIQDKFKINYGYVYRSVMGARKEILKDKIHKYKNKRLKHRKMKGIQLGDLVEKITKATGIKRIVEHFWGDECGCEERKAKLNELFSHKNLKPKCLDDDEIKEYEKFVSTRHFQLTDKGATGVILDPEIMFVLGFYETVFGIRYEKPSCLSCSGTAKLIVKLVKELDTVFVNNVKLRKTPAESENIDSESVKPKNGAVLPKKKPSRSKQRTEVLRKTGNVNKKELN